MTLKEYLTLLEKEDAHPLPESQVRARAVSTPQGIPFPIARGGCDGIRAVRRGNVLLVFVTNGYENRRDLQAQVTL